MIRVTLPGVEGEGTSTFAPLRANIQHDLFASWGGSMESVLSHCRRLARQGRLAALLLLALGVPVPAPGQGTDMQDPSFASAVRSLLQYEHLAPKCSSLSSRDSVAVEAWKDDNDVDVLHRRIGELEADPLHAPSILGVRADLQRRFGDTTFMACRMVTLTIRSREAQFASVTQVLAAAASSPAWPPPPVGTPSTESPSPESASQVSRPEPLSDPSGGVNPALDVLDSFGFDSRPRMGGGGFMTVDIYPVVLFRNGDALTDVKGLSHPDGLAGHRRASPDRWTEWRRTGGRIELRKASGWTALAFPTTYDRLPDGFRLEGLYRSVSGAGTVATGGNQSVIAWSEYTFTPDGRVTRGGGAGSTSGEGGGSVVAGAMAPRAHGTYRVEGLMLHMQFEDGSRESRVLITDPNDARRAIWLDGEGYVQRSR